MILPLFHILLKHFVNEATIEYVYTT